VTLSRPLAAGRDFQGEGGDLHRSLRQGDGLTGDGGLGGDDRRGHGRFGGERSGGRDGQDRQGGEGGQLHGVSPGAAVAEG
jgi:hypothetical protein